MKIVISPAKSLNFEKELPTTQFTQPSLLNESKKSTCGFETAITSRIIAIDVNFG